MNTVTQFISLIIILIHVNSGNSLEFNKKFTGVLFEPYVKTFGGGVSAPESLQSYTPKDIKTMLEVVSKKFSNVIVGTLDIEDVPYKQTITGLYHNDALIRATICETAAQINLERNRTSLTLIIGVVNDHKHPEYTHSEIGLIVDSAKKANSIYPGTVEGLMFAKYDSNSLELTTRTLQWIREIRPKLSVHDGLKVGSMQNCGSAHQQIEITDISVGGLYYDKILGAKYNIYRNSDFVVCEFLPNQKHGFLGAKHSFDDVHQEVLRYRPDIKGLKKDIKVFGLTYFPSGGNKSWHNPENLVEYWEELDKFASKHNYQMFLPTFDNPYRKWEHAHLGWWKLKRNDLVDKVSGYVEKVDGISIGNNFSTRTLIFAIVGTLFAILIPISVCIVLLYLKRRPLVRILLSSEEIQEFLEGNIEEDALEYNFGNVPAMNQPYDKKLEISKKNLEIRHDQILGMGQFGCVFTARITKGTEVVNVALKTTKRDCPPTALKGLLSEIKILTYLGKHPNIVSIVGAYTAELENGVVYIATELCVEGCLKKYLEKLRKSTMGAEYENKFHIHTDLYRWSYEIACGMEYLEEKGVIHADLATRNVLLTREKTAKITDFGLSRRLYDYEKYVKETREALPWRWMAIESLKCMEFSTKSDVWSYGVTLWEIFSLGGQPFPIVSWSLDFIQKLENGMRLKKPSYATAEVYSIMMNCWKLSPNERPNFTDLKTLTKHFQATEKYTNLQ